MSRLYRNMAPFYNAAIVGVEADRSGCLGSQRQQVVQVEHHRRLGETQLALEEALHGERLVREAVRHADQREMEGVRRVRLGEMSSLTSRPAMTVLPAPGSSASRNRSGWRGSIAA